ncbi:MAG: hypothetical protein ACRDIY_06990 [Chloroflexota bacterium]
MAESTRCGVDGCGAPATRRCASCGCALCRDHAIADYHHLPGGQRPYCRQCDGERRAIYRRLRVQGRRAIGWSAGGAFVGAVVGYLTVAAITPDSFSHTIGADVGFLVGLALALLVALSTARPGAS